MKVFINYDMDGLTLERIKVDGIVLDIDAIKDKTIPEWFLPSHGRDGWEGLVKEMQKAVADDNKDIQLEFFGLKENKKIFEDNLKRHGVLDFENDNEEKNRNEFLREARNHECRGQKKLAFSKYLLVALGYNYAEAQYKVAEYYTKGYGCEVDEELAVEWYEKAANQGNAWAQESLGDCYYNGEGVEKDYKQAVEWYEKAANQRNASAQNKLACRYYAGEGVEKDYKQAVEWFEKAVNQGNAWAQNNLGNCYYHGNGVEKDYKQAVGWYEKSANQGYADAQFNLGKCYGNGNGVNQDLRKAFEWSNKSANQGNVSAQSYCKNLNSFWSPPIEIPFYNE